ncbi:diguanylate cyclase/phosphodiesterase (GGDEF & EAL domains) with PAS/PAC sensor(s) [hydrothermal vent metagenome]|uniref:Diguanylate cyclase/phosphodiesterase (GGDEF & EAL domains) with PAS/PAC sensor(S) n=1 Tax=hydrothermal vent metagenome TaxID=652676 RepID=A0A3B1BTZ3_9ZZZZ
MSRAIIIYLLIGLLLLSGLSFIYFKTRTFEIEQSRHVAEDIRNVAQTNSLLNRKLMEVNYGILNNYDPLSQLSRQLKQRYQHLSEELHSFSSGEKDIMRQLKILHDSLDDKNRQLQDLTSMIALLKNSRAYFPRAVADIKQELKARQAPLRLHQQLDILLNHILIYSLNGNRSTQEQAQQYLQWFTNNIDDYPSSLLPTINNLLSHTRLLLRQKKQVDDLLQKTVLLPVPHNLDMLNKAYHLYHQERLAHVDRYRLALYLFSLLLLFYLLYVLARLQRTTRSLRLAINESKQAEQALRKANRALQVLSNANQLLVRSTDEKELLQEICRIIIDDGNYHFAWVGFAEQDQGKHVVAAAQAGFNESYIASLKISWADNKYGQGPTGVAIRTGQACAIRNILHDPRYEPWRETALKQGYQSSIALPLRHDSTTFGALNIYSSETQAFDDDELLLLQELADDVAFGIVTLRNQKEYQNTQRQLQQARKMEAIGHLTGGIAHDFNNILASIMGYTSLALDRYVDDRDSKLGQYLQEVYQAGERARDLVAQMLAFSRNSGGKARLLALPPLVNEVVRMLSATLPSDIRITTEVEKNLPWTIIDPIQLHQIIMNLCINARDAIQNHGRIQIKLQRNVISDYQCMSCHGYIDGDFVELSIEDTGSGIKPDIIPYIFDPFFTTKDIGKGTGMGLPTVHGIVHKYGGHILVQNSPTGGALFKIFLPVAEQMENRNQVVQEPVSTDIPSSDPAHILVVDDDKSIARFIAELLESQGYRITLHHNGQEAWDYFRCNGDSIDLVITDQTMPIMKGDELAQRLITLKADLPIILCSGYSAHINEIQERNIGIQAFLSKPLTLQTLLECIRTLLAKEHRGEGSVAKRME